MGMLVLMQLYRSNDAVPQAEDQHSIQLGLGNT